MADVMLDLETLSTRPEAVVLVIGAIKFNPYQYNVFSNDTLYLKPNVDEQIDMGRHVDDNTVEWWGRQPEEVRDEAMSEEGRISGEETLAKLNKYLVGVNKIWTQGPVFDIGILENLYRMHNMPPPWSHWQIHDSRTMFSIFGDPRKEGRDDFHNALADCVYQAKGLQQVFKMNEIVPYDRWTKKPCK